MQRRKPWSMQTKRNRRVAAHGFFQWVIDEKQQITNNPAKFKIDITGEDYGDTEIFTVEETKQLISTAINKEPEVLHYILLCFFAGLRPFEARRMTTKNVVNGHINVEKWMTKTKDARYIKILPCLATWLEKYPLPKRPRHHFTKL